MARPAQYRGDAGEDRIAVGFGDTVQLEKLLELEEQVCLEKERESRPFDEWRAARQHIADRLRAEAAGTPRPPAESEIPLSRAA